ncbi:MAG: FAD-dependent oxidoreductase [Methylotenera sp.]|nr:FAD-dependent oxidoreductase [Methylotenera sp.]
MATPLNQQPDQQVAIIGAGCAGLSAAAHLASQGVKVTLFESAPQLGGRARGLSYKGLQLDNGQHIMLGAYQHTLALLKQAGMDERELLLRQPLKLSVINLNTQAKMVLKTANWLPAPLHLLSGLISAQGLTFADKWAAVRLILWLRWHGFSLKQDATLQAFLSQQKQPQSLINYLWEPLCLAALNTPLTLASTQVFINVLRDSFTKSKHDSDLLLPRQDLSKVLAEPLAHYIEQHGGEIKRMHVVSQIQASQTGFTVVSKARSHAFSHLIIACAPHQLKHIETTLPLAIPPFSYQAITTVYLQFEPSLQLPQAMIGLSNSLAQWVFDRGQLCGQHGLLAVIISAHAPSSMTQEALAQTITQELTTAFPTLTAPIWHKVITEKNATFSCNAALNRPTHATFIKHLWLTGDYVQADYPATIESAVKSGINCAEVCLATLNAS